MDAIAEAIPRLIDEHSKDNVKEDIHGIITKGNV